MMDQKEEMKKNLLEELDDYFMQLVYRIWIYFI